MNPLQRTFEDIAQRDFDDCEELSRSELRAGRISWDYMSEPAAEIAYYQKLQAQAQMAQYNNCSTALPKRAIEPGIYDELQFEPAGLPPEFWRGIMIAAAASSVLWVGAFYLLTWWIA